MEVKAEELFHRYITNAKTKDAALSAFDRDVRRKLYNEAEEKKLRELFQPIRQERINKRKLSDIGGVAEKRVFRLRDVEHNVRIAKNSLDQLERPDDVMLAILFMTGRRSAEIGTGTKFTKTKFTGTVKGGKEFGTARYLCSSERIYRGLAYLKANGWRGLTVEQVNKVCAVPLMRRLEMYKGVEKVHDLRKMHMAVWIRRLSKRKAIRAMSSTDRAEYIGRFVNDALGHTNPTSAIPYLNCEIK